MTMTATWALLLMTAVSSLLSSCHSMEDLPQQNASSPEQLPQPQHVRQLITFQRPQSEPEHCYQMTWDYEWAWTSKTKCRGKICRKPFYDGEVEPDVTSFATVCKLKYGETCMKYVKYDRYDRKTPTFIARYCGRGNNDGSVATTSCHLDTNNAEHIGICFCRDQDKCNSAMSFQGIWITYAFVVINMFVI